MVPATVAIQTAPRTDAANRTLDTATTITPIPTSPRTGISIGRSSPSFNSRFFSGSPVALSDQLVIVHSIAMTNEMIRPVPNTNGCATNPTAIVTTPNAVNNGHGDDPVDI